MKGWRERAAYVLQKHGAIAAKKKFASGPLEFSVTPPLLLHQRGQTLPLLLVCGGEAGACGIILAMKRAIGKTVTGCLMALVLALPAMSGTPLTAVRSAVVYQIVLRTFTREGNFKAAAEKFGNH